MPSTPPSTTTEILATSNIDPSFAEAFKNKHPSQEANRTITDLKQENAAALPALQKSLSESRPHDITETTHSFRLRDDHPSRII
ncbi:hypothetical protein LTR40_009254, partial [Exophiala xenobiotica]